MDPFVVFDCEEVLPNRFALTMAAVARSRALNRGAETRIDRDGHSSSTLALHEMAAGAFTRDELAPFLPQGGQRLALPGKAPGFRLRDGCAEDAALALTSPRTETVH